MISLAQNQFNIAARQCSIKQTSKRSVTWHCVGYRRLPHRWRHIRRRVRAVRYAVLVRPRVIYGRWLRGVNCKHEKRINDVTPTNWIRLRVNAKLNQFLTKGYAFCLVSEKGADFFYFETAGGGEGSTLLNRPGQITVVYPLFDRCDRSLSNLTI